QKRLRGWEGFRLPACGVDQQFQRGAHRDVVVNDEYDGCGVQHDRTTSTHSRAKARPAPITSFCYRPPRIDLPESLGFMADHPRPSVIAVVDDDPMILESIESLLNSADHEVRLFSTAAALLESGGLAEIDCLISDVAMPLMDGFELARAVQAVRPALPGIFVTRPPDRV